MKHLIDNFVLRQLHNVHTQIWKKWGLKQPIDRINLWRKRICGIFFNLYVEMVHFARCDVITLWKSHFTPSKCYYAIHVLISYYAPKTTWVICIKLAAAILNIQMQGARTCCFMSPSDCSPSTFGFSWRGENFSRVARDVVREYDRCAMVSTRNQILMAHAHNACVRDCTHRPSSPATFRTHIKTHPRTKWDKSTVFVNCCASNFQWSFDQMTCTVDRIYRDKKQQSWRHKAVFRIGYALYTRWWQYPTIMPNQKLLVWILAIIDEVHKVIQSHLKLVSWHTLVCW